MLVGPRIQRFWSFSLFLFSCFFFVFFRSVFSCFIFVQVEPSYPAVLDIFSLNVFTCFSLFRFVSVEAAYPRVLSTFLHVLYFSRVVRIRIWTGVGEMVHEPTYGVFLLLHIPHARVFVIWRRFGYLKKKIFSLPHPQFFDQKVKKIL